MLFPLTLLIIFARFQPEFLQLHIQGVDFVPEPDQFISPAFSHSCFTFQACKAIGYDTLMLLFKNKMRGLIFLEWGIFWRVTVVFKEWNPSASLSPSITPREDGKQRGMREILPRTEEEWSTVGSWRVGVVLGLMELGWEQLYKDRDNWKTL